MHVYFSGIGGMGIGPLALIAHQAGYQVSGSDKQSSQYLAYLKDKGLTNVHVGQTYDQIAAVHQDRPIDWLVFSSAVSKEQAHPAELRFCQEQGIKATKRAEFLTTLLDEKQQQLIAVAGTHGKTTTTAMTIWTFKQLGLPVSYAVGAKLGFGDMGAFDPKSTYFVYEADEYDRNFLSLHPRLSLITGIDWDHPDTYPSREDYNAAFRQFITQSGGVMVWRDDLQRLSSEATPNLVVLDPNDPKIDNFTLAGLVNRRDAAIVAWGLEQELKRPPDELMAILNCFPGLSRRFEEIVPRLYSDYAHTPQKIRGALQLAHELIDNNKLIVVYEGLHNTRQHFIKHELYDLFDDVKQLYVVPSYLAREDPDLRLMSPADLIKLLSPKSQALATPAALNEALKRQIQEHLARGQSVLCLTAGGGNSLDEWLRQEFQT